MDLSAMWAKAQGERELPDAEPVRNNHPHYTADQMRAAMTPDPAALRRFAEAVAEECARLCERTKGIGRDGWPEHFTASECAAAIRRHVRGDR